MAARLTTAQVRALVDSVYAPISHTHVIGNIIGLQTVLDGKSNTGHTHAFNDIPGLQAALDAKANLNGATFTGALLLPDGTVSAPGIAFSGQTGSGMWRDSNGLQFSHNGTHAFEVRSSGIFFRQSAQPATDNARTMGAFNLRFARMHATHYRPRLEAPTDSCLMMVLETLSTPGFTQSALLMCEWFSMVQIDLM